jgi:uncharacterized membrane protein YccC
MRFQPTKQLNAILQQEYFEPTISWALRVVFALNVPLLLLPLKTGFHLEIVWMAFTAYLLSLLDFRGPHYQKVFVQIVESVFIIFAAIVGMNVADNIWYSIVCMFVIGFFAALLRNWSDYGAAIGIAMGFFYLFGLANPASFHHSMHYAQWMLYGAAWALFITLTSFLFNTSNPLKRSVAIIWKRNTELLDAIVKENLVEKPNIALIIEKEIAVRTAINKSIELFKRKNKVAQDIQKTHYNLLIELRKTSSLFGASITSLHEGLETLNGGAFEEIRSSVIYKTLSAFGQASARIAIVVFTNRKEDFTLANVRLRRCQIAIQILTKTCNNLQLTEKEKLTIEHFIQTLQISCDYLQQAVQLLETKLNLKKSVQMEEYKLSFNNFLAGLNFYEWLTALRSLFNVNSQQFKYALRVAIALCIGVFIFMYFHINHGYWIPLTIIIVIQPYYGATLKKGIERVAGTIAGIIVGGIITLFNLPHLFYVVLLVIVSFYIVYFIRHNYKVGVFFLTLMMVILLHISSLASWQLIGWRVLSTCIGSVLAVLAGYAFWPMWEKQQFPTLMSNALQQNKNYLKLIIAYLLNEQTDNDSWIKQRNKVEAANSDVFACVQRMNIEPQHIQQNIDKSFSLVGINIRIAREITSIALSLSSLKNENITSKGLPSYQQQLVEIIDILDDLIADKKIASLPDFKSLNTLSTQVRLEISSYHFIKTEFEKIIFELENMYMILDKNNQ